LIQGSFGEDDAGTVKKKARPEKSGRAVGFYRL
jgi:hypothetical protein